MVAPVPPGAAGLALLAGGTLSVLSVFAGLPAVGGADVGAGAGVGAVAPAGVAAGVAAGAVGVTGVADGAGAIKSMGSGN